MGNLNKVTYTDHQTVITAANLNNIQDSVIANTSYSTCTTAANTAAKTAALTNFVLTTGSCIRVRFTYSNTASSPTLNVNGTGAKAIKQYGTAAAGADAFTSWPAGAVVTFVYDGTYWLMADHAVGHVAGETISISGTLQCPGSWASTTSLRFTIPLTDEVLHASSVTISGGGYIRCDGTVNLVQTWSSSGTVTCGLTRHGVDVNVVFSSAPSYAKANYPVIVQPASSSLTFA